ncbi:MAG: hypothetical protein ABSE96_05875 [Terracidiphilus sp.]
MDDRIRQVEELMKFPERLAITSCPAGALLLFLADYRYVLCRPQEPRANPRSAGWVPAGREEKNNMAGEMKGNVSPPLEMPAHLRERHRAPEKKDPLLLRLITYVLVVRALTFLLLAFILWSFPDSAIGAYLVTSSDFFFKRPHHFESVEQIRQSAHDFLMIGFLLVGLVYSVVAWKWLTRFWLARWGTMFLAGATLLKTGINLLADRASGVDTQFTAAQTQALEVSSILNLAIVLYLAFSPGVAEAFKETPWE